MDLKLDGKRALVTGGSRGIGKAVARALLKEGANVVVAARTAAALHETAEELGRETGGLVLALTFDGRDGGSVCDLVENTVGRLGGLDIVVNAAAKPGSATPKADLAGLTAEGVIEDLDTKVLGYMRVAQAAAPHLIANGWGRIINISGLAARSTGNYAGSIRNVAVAALTKNLADELGPKGVNVTVVHPGATRTERTAARIEAKASSEKISLRDAERALYGHNLIGRIVEAEEIAAIVAFLASPLSAAINGDAIVAGGGSAKVIYY